MTSPRTRTSAVTNPRQLAPTVGLAHGGVEFLEGSLLGIEELAIPSDEEEPASSLFYDREHDQI